MTSSIKSNGVADANDPRQYLTIPPTEDSKIDQEFGIFMPLPPTNHSVHEVSSTLVLDFVRKADESPSGSYNVATNTFTYEVGNDKQIQQVDIPRRRPMKKQPLLSPKGQDVYRSPIYHVLTQDLQPQRRQQQTTGNGAGETQDARLDNRTVSQKRHKTGSHLADTEGREEILTNRYEADVPNELPQPQKKVRCFPTPINPRKTNRRTIASFREEDSRRNVAQKEQGAEGSPHITRDHTLARANRYAAASPPTPQPGLASKRADCQFCWGGLGSAGRCGRGDWGDVGDGGGVEGGTCGDAGEDGGALGEECGGSCGWGGRCRWEVPLSLVVM